MATTDQVLKEKYVNTILNKNIKLVDGSFGFQLNEHLKNPLDGDPLWSARALFVDPEAVISVHTDYIKAGCDIIETNSYQASIQGFEKYLKLSPQDSYCLIKTAVVLTKTAIARCQINEILKEGERPLIAGSVGPYGAFLHDGSEYNGFYTDFISEEELKDYHKPRISALVEEGVDLLALETIPSRKEAAVLVEIIKDYPKMKAWLSFSCRTEDSKTAHGDDFVEAANYCYDLNPNQIIAVGVNCIKPSAVEALIKDVNKNREKPIPLIVYANSGEKYDANLGWNNVAETLEPYIATWLDLGVKYLGGCCRVCANYISKIKEEIAKWEKKKPGQMLILSLFSTCVIEFTLIFF